MKRGIIFVFFIFACFLTSAVFAAEMVDINTASLAQLETLTGIGPVKAQAIIDARPFSSLDDLDRAKGIGPATLQKIKDQGLACVNCSNYSNLPNSSNQIPNTNDQNPNPTPNTQNPTPIVVYPSGIFINEILANPEGADETEEWIELYNSNNSVVDLSGWQIQDAVGTTATYIIPAGVNISANGFLVFKRPETKIILNNDEDKLNLLTPDDKVVDSVNYSKAPLGQSYNKNSNNWAWSVAQTPRSQNIITSAATKTLPETKKNDNSNEVEAGLADLSRTANPWFLFIIVLAATLILATAVLIIKFKFSKNEHVRS